MAETFIFEGFEPNDELKCYAKDVLWQIEGRSPGQSSRSARLSKTKAGLYQGALKVSSAVGVFEATAESATPRATIEQLYQRIGELLQEWSESRSS